MYWRDSHPGTTLLVANMESKLFTQHKHPKVSKGEQECMQKQAYSGCSIIPWVPTIPSFCLSKQFLCDPKRWLNSLISFCSETIYFHLHYKCWILSNLSTVHNPASDLVSLPFSLSRCSSCILHFWKGEIIGLEKHWGQERCQTKGKHAAILKHSHGALGIVIHSFALKTCVCSLCKGHKRLAYFATVVSPTGTHN